MIADAQTHTVLELDMKPRMILSPDLPAPPSKHRNHKLVYKYLSFPWESLSVCLSSLSPLHHLAMF